MRQGCFYVISAVFGGVLMIALDNKLDIEYSDYFTAVSRALEYMYLSMECLCSLYFSDRGQGRDS